MSLKKDPVIQIIKDEIIIATARSHICTAIPRNLFEIKMNDVTLVTAGNNMAAHYLEDFQIFIDFEDYQIIYDNCEWIIIRDAGYLHDMKIETLTVRSSKKTFSGNVAHINK